MTDTMKNEYDVVVIGGGAAGLSGALTLARSRRSVLVVDAGQPRNAAATGVHNFLTRDGMSPSAMIEAGRAEVLGYGGHVVPGRVASAARGDDGFTVVLDDGREITARRLLMTTGGTDELPDLPGVRERWGRDVLHCPYCHGWEVRDQPIGVLGGPMAVHQALLFRQLTADLTLFLHTAPRPTEAEWEQLTARGVSVVEGEVVSLDITDDQLTGVRLRTGSVIPLQALVVGPYLSVRVDLLANLGLKVAAHPSGIADYVEADATGLTAVPGIWVAGNVADPKATVIAAAAAGLQAAATINADLVIEEAEQAVAIRRQTHPAGAGAGIGHQAPASPPVHGDNHGHEAQVSNQVFDQAFWDDRYRSQNRVWSGNPNPQLVSLAPDLMPGAALDVGSGEGADAIWLAERGWRVTAVDISAVALERSSVRAAEIGADMAGRIDWLRQDLTEWAPEPATFDLVSAQFMHLPKDAREAMFGRLAAAVTPGGCLLIVGHDPSDLQTTMPRPQLPDLFFTASEVAESLDPLDWDVLVCEARARQVSDPDDHLVTIHDAVLLARRHS